MFQLPDEVKKDIENYKHSLEGIKDKEISLSRFKGVRVPWGIYSQRYEKAYMTRIRIPAGAVNPSQLRALAYVSKEYGDAILHITTRQDIQIHNVKLEDTIKIMEYLKEHNLSSRGGGGNTVRNIISCALSGVCKEEIFEVRKYAISLTECLLRQDTSFNLPRKFKISFSGCTKDCSGCLVNDLGFLAEKKNEKEGFKVFVGGGMGANSRLGDLLEEFIAPEDLGYCAIAVKNVFFKNGERRDRHHNRLRFLIDGIGIDKFRVLYKKEFSDLKDKEYIALRKIDSAKRDQVDGQTTRQPDADYKEFLKYSVSLQKQKGYSAVELRIPRGDISADKLAALADLEKNYPGIEFHTSQNQNLFISWIKNKDLYRLFLKLKEILEVFLYSQTLLDVVACKGALTCNLGLCNSPGLAGEIEVLIKKEFIGKKVFKELDIKLNGCPNSCGQHPIGKISFYGMVRRVDNRPVPFYKFLLGGRREAQKTKFAKEIGIIPAKNIPKFLREFLEESEKVIDKNKDIYDFLDGRAEDIAKVILEKYSYVPSFSENRDFYFDWGKAEEFSLSGLGPGECGAGVLDMIEADLLQAGLSLESAEKENYSIQYIKQSLFLSARALLVVRGSDPKNPEEALFNFKTKFVEEGIISSAYSDIKNVYENINEKLSLEEKKQKFLYAGKFLQDINRVYRNMDSSFNFPKVEVEKKSESKQKIARFLDLKGTPCPINYVKVKLELENFVSGDIIEVLLDEGEPIRNVPKSLKDDGHEILKIEKQDGFYKVLVKKG